MPQFWAWLEEMAAADRVAVPLEIWEEFRDGRELLGAWARRPEVKRNLVLSEEADPDLVDEVVARGYAPDLDDTEVVKLGRDPFLISYAYRRPRQCCVVSNETSAPRRQRANRKVPDVCRVVGVRCIRLVDLVNELDFRIS